MAAIAVSWGSKVPTRCSGDTWGELARAGLSITVFAVGMIVGAPLVAMLTLRLPRRLTLLLALAVFAAGHVVAAGAGFSVLLGARFPDGAGGRGVHDKLPRPKNKQWR